MFFEKRSVTLFDGVKWSFPKNKIKKTPYISFKRRFTTFFSRFYPFFKKKKLFSTILFRFYEVLKNCLIILIKYEDFSKLQKIEILR